MCVWLGVCTCNVTANTRSYLKQSWRMSQGPQPQKFTKTVIGNIPGVAPLSCQICFLCCCQVLQGQQLKNPHLAVKHSPLAGGRVALVQGDYLYYHYMQDGFNDNVRDVQNR